MLQLEQLTLNIPDTTKPRVVIIGGGFGAVNLTKNLPDEQFQVVMLSKQNYHGFWPLLYQVATAGLEPESIAEPIRKLFDDHKDFHFRFTRVNSINPAAKTVSTVIGDVPYDYLVIATGTKSNYFGNEQIKQNAFGLKHLSDAINLRSQLLQSFEQANLTKNPEARRSLLNIVIAGAGPTGVELAGSLAEMRQHVLPRDYPGMDFREMNIYLVDGLDRVLPPMSPESSRHTHGYLEKLGVIIKLNKFVESYDGQTVKFKDGEEIRSQTLVWAAGVAGATIEGLPAETVERGRYLVNTFNQVQGFTDVFAIGDVAVMKSEKWPKGHPQVAQPAIQQGVHLAKNLVRKLRGDEWKPFSYFDKGSLAIVGRARAVADLPGKKSLSGFIAWVAWLFVHIYYLVGFRNKLIVMANWVYRFFTYQRGTRIIIQPYVNSEDKAAQEYVRLQTVD
ncbi:NAD(P)/FAD-dependent oxidoreductase [Hymenobacter psychrotolerans]|uniref:NADH:ubiquinone reductase (non-electrogenic) n=1 Tax=Hymenobacter psychrotolerans DSM 18569 TaxID=1121959 RepID=A0A1M7FMG7_9BACT|nr:NAD(P)/FAD-dependent oxidoreductase [Hymenobacter psychrotolerans]SHM05292.1 NADH dehydrogenase [Hymenobacter psychrotolerans DSM 18569]